MTTIGQDNPFASFDSIFQDNGVEVALAQIIDSKSDRIRCVLSGAPYATIDSDEIRNALQSYRRGNMTATTENLLDSWDLQLLTFCSGVAPSLRNRNHYSLAMIADSGPNGAARVLTYYMARLMYPVPHNATLLSSTKATERMHFARELFDSLAQVGSDGLAESVQGLAACDAWLALGRWNRLGLFQTQATKNGLYAKHNGKIRGWFIDPESMPRTIESVKAIIRAMQIMLVVATQDGHPIPGEGSRESLNLLTDLPSALPVPQQPVKRKENDSYAAQMAEIAFIKEMNNRPEVRIAWSATHGKGHVAGAPWHNSRKAQSDSTKAKATKDDSAKEAAKAKREAAKLATPKGRKEALAKEIMAEIFAANSIKF